MRKTMLAATLATMLTMPAAAAGAGAGCRAKNLNTGQTSADLAGLMVGAGAGTTTIQIGGRCVGNFVVGAGQRISLIGKGKAKLDAAGSGTVLTVAQSAALDLVNLTVTGGSTTGGGAGGGIYNNEGYVSLWGSTRVIGNSAAGGLGGGIFNRDGGRLHLFDSSSVTGNSAFRGGGIDNQGYLLVAHSSTVTGNTATSGLGGGVYTEPVYPSAIGIACNTWSGTISPNTPDDPQPLTPGSC